LAKPNNTAPFLARGLVYQGIRDFAMLRVGPDVVSRLQPQLAEHLSPPLLPSVEYDALPLVPICRALAALAGTDEAEYVTANAHWQAEHDLGALHKLYLEMSSPASAALKLPSTAARYFNFGGGSAERVDDNAVRITNLGVPDEMVDWWLAACRGFSAVVLQRAGGKRPTLERQPSDRSDAKTVTISFVVRWE
jgi:hypothetical protein